MYNTKADRLFSIKASIKSLQSQEEELETSIIQEATEAEGGFIYKSLTIEGNEHAFKLSTTDKFKVLADKPELKSYLGEQYGEFIEEEYTISMSSTKTNLEEVVKLAKSMGIECGIKQVLTAKKGTLEKVASLSKPMFNKFTNYFKQTAYGLRATTK